MTVVFINSWVWRLEQTRRRLWTSSWRLFSTLISKWPMEECPGDQGSALKALKWPWKAFPKRAPKWLWINLKYCKILSRWRTIALRRGWGSLQRRTRTYSPSTWWMSRRWPKTRRSRGCSWSSIQMAPGLSIQMSFMSCSRKIRWRSTLILSKPCLIIRLSLLETLRISIIPQGHYFVSEISWGKSGIQ